MRAGAPWTDALAMAVALPVWPAPGVTNGAGTPPMAMSVAVAAGHRAVRARTIRTLRPGGVAANHSNLALEQMPEPGESGDGEKHSPARWQQNGGQRPGVKTE